MPNTRLSLEDFDLIDKIIANQIGNLWVRAFDLNQRNSMTPLELADLTRLGNQLMGSVAFSVYYSETTSLTKVEQNTADIEMKIFLNEYRDDVEIATIVLMPLTTLTKSEYQRIKALLDYKLGPGDLWTRYLQQDTSLTVAERNRVA